MREMQSDPDICAMLATINETLADNEDASVRYTHSYLYIGSMIWED
jgi:hypothetical protein